MRGKSLTRFYFLKVHVNAIASVYIIHIIIYVCILYTFSFSFLDSISILAKWATTDGTADNGNTIGKRLNNFFPCSLKSPSLFPTCPFLCFKFQLSFCAFEFVCVRVLILPPDAFVNRLPFIPNPTLHMPAECTHTRTLPQSPAANELATHFNAHRRTQHLKFIRTKSHFFISYYIYYFL